LCRVVDLLRTDGERRGQHNTEDQDRRRAFGPHRYETGGAGDYLSKPAPSTVLGETRGGNAKPKTAQGGEGTEGLEGKKELNPTR